MAGRLSVLIAAFVALAGAAYAQFAPPPTNFDYSFPAAYAWGLNQFGGFGDTSAADSFAGKAEPRQVWRGAGWTSLDAAAIGFTCGVRAGQAWCWGYNAHGAVGDSTTTNRTSPTLVSGGWSDWQSITTGYYHTCGIRGTSPTQLAYCWGYNLANNLGDGTTTQRTSPTLVSGGYTDWTVVRSKVQHTCGIRGGDLYCWGSNAVGQLGDETLVNSPVPTQVHGGITGWTDVAPGWSHTCGISNGQAYCWGEGGYHSLGNGSATDRTTPTLVSGGFTDWVKLAATLYNTCGIRGSGLLYCWGLSNYWLNGDGIFTTRTTPTLVAGGFTDWTDISLNQFHACGVRASGHAYCWGMGAGARTGNGNNVTLVASPSTLSTVSGGFTDWTAVAPGGFQTCALRGGVAYCWGYNANGQLGNTTTSATGNITPTVVSGGFTDWTRLAGGLVHTCGLRGVSPSQTAYCWGHGTFGQLGYSGTAQRTSPSLVSGGFTDWTVLVSSAGGYTTCGLRATGRAYCWGYNNYGQVGDGSTTNRSTPTEVFGTATDWTAITMGLFHSCGIRSGQAYCWGYNFYGQVGNTSTTDRVTPTLVSGGFTDWSAVAGGTYHTCGLRGGTAYCWGYNPNSALGDGTNTNRTSPTLVTGGITDWVMLSAGNQTTCGLRSTGQAYCWGYGGFGQVGDGAITSRATPTLVSGGWTDWISIQPGNAHTCGIRGTSPTQTAYCWGSYAIAGNNYGQLGNGSIEIVAIPTPVSWTTFVSLTSISAGLHHTVGIGTP